ncbi:hypothetical protein [Intestinibacter sp.]|uniref:hypothetical protein n=1 Tax=Intestinibacter sp. TaxID=1965304 RepID=UPI003F169FF6
MNRIEYCIGLKNIFTEKEIAFIRLLATLLFYVLEIDFDMKVDEELKDKSYLYVGNYFYKIKTYEFKGREITDQDFNRLSKKFWKYILSDKESFLNRFQKL